MRERDGGELRRAQRLRHGELVRVRRRRARGERRRGRSAHEQCHGQDDDPGDAAQHQHGGAPVVAGMISARESGATRSEPMASPAETRATARLRFSVNQRVVVAIIGA